MLLEPGGAGAAVLGGRAVLAAAREGETVRLTLEDQSSFESIETTLRLETWHPDAYEVYDWVKGGALVLCGARAVVALTASALRVASAVALEYEEGDTIDRPWFVESDQDHLLVVATERRIWCLDDRAAVRWIWTCRGSAEARWVYAVPRIDGARLIVPVRARSRDAFVELSMEDGLEQ